MKQNTLILGVIALLALAGTAHAQDITTSTTTTTSAGVRVEQKANPLNLIKRDFMGKRAEDRALIQEKREDIRVDMKAQHDLMMKKRGEMHNATTTEQKMEMRADMKADKETFKDGIKERRAEIKDIRHEIIKARFTGMAARFSTLISRIDSRIEKLKAEGKDVTVSAKAIAEAKVTYAEIQADVKALATTTATVGADETRELNKEALESIKTKMKKLHEELKRALMGLKDIKVEVKTGVSAGTSTTAR